MRLRATVVASLLGLLTACNGALAPSSQGDSGTTEDNIIAGFDARSPALDAVGSLGYVQYGESQPFCSAALIGPETVLTARHCVEDIDGVFFQIGPDGYAPRRWNRVVAQTEVPFGEEPGMIEMGRDLAILHLEDPILDVKPVKVGGSLSAANVDSRYLMIGYGINDASGASGDRRMGAATLNAVEGRVYEQVFGDFDAWLEYLRSVGGVEMISQTDGSARLAKLIRSGLQMDSTPEICDDGIDNDGDGYADCDDAVCYRAETCARPEHCSNGLDDDLDGAWDCEDPDCAYGPSCTYVDLEFCGDGEDNDFDGLIDCDDSDCNYDSICRDPEALLREFAEQQWQAVMLEGSEVYVGNRDGDAQACNGDSGGPLLSFENGEYVVHAVASWVPPRADNLCVRGAFYASFDDVALAAIERAKQWTDTCGDYTAAGTCEGNEAVRCTATNEGERRISRLPCDQFGQVCGIDFNGEATCQ